MKIEPCQKCHGHMTIDWMPSEQQYVQMRPCFRCINCGWRNDLVYNLNRQTQQKEVCYDPVGR